MSEYCLRWNNHRPNLVTVFSELLTSEALVDVTLATDGHYIHAHKLVLSACSVYFKDLFGANPCKHPIVILKDIRIEDLKTVIDFIYRGEVNVAQDRLQDVLRTAESLRIKGLAENPRSFDDGGASHGGGGARFSSSSLGSQVTRQRSSLTDSREQSLSLEADDDGEPSTPPTSKRRKITASHDSSESLHDDGGDGEVERERGRGGGLCEVKDEPVDDGDGENKTPSRDHTNTNTNTNTDIDSAMGGSQEGVGGGVGGDDNTSSGLGISAAAAAGTSSSSDPCLTPTTHTQGSVCRWEPPPSLDSLLVGPYTPPGQPNNNNNNNPNPNNNNNSNTNTNTPGSSPPTHTHVHTPTHVHAASTSPLSPSALLQYPMHPPPPAYFTPKGWSPQFRRMSPNMLMAIEAVRSGKMGFTQAGKTFSVNGRTLWVYYRKLGYEVHNTFRGRRNKGAAGSANTNSNTTGGSGGAVTHDTTHAHTNTTANNTLQQQQQQQQPHHNIHHHQQHQQQQQQVNCATASSSQQQQQQQQQQQSLHPPPPPPPQPPPPPHTPHAHTHTHAHQTATPTPLLPNAIVPKQEDLQLPPTAHNNSDHMPDAAQGYGDTVMPLDHQQPYGYGHPHSATAELAAQDDMQAEDASRALQSLLESYNLRNMWTSPT